MRAKDLHNEKYEGYVAADDANGSGKFKIDNIIKNFAPVFVPNSTTTVAGLPYTYKDILVVAKQSYQGPWDASKFTQISVGDIIKYFSKTNKLDSMKLSGISKESGNGNSIDGILLAKSSSLTQLDRKIYGIPASLELGELQNGTIGSATYNYVWRNLATTQHYIIDISKLRGLHITDSSASTRTYALLNYYKTPVEGEKPFFCEDKVRVTGAISSLQVPSDACYLYIASGSSWDLPVLVVDEATNGDMQNLTAEVNGAKTSIAYLNHVVEDSISYGAPVFKAFGSRQSSSPSNNFRGFATRYSASGLVYGLSVVGNFHSTDGEDVEATVSIYDGNFSQVLYSKNVTVADDTREVKFILDAPLNIDGNFYIAVQAVGENNRFRVAQRSSDYTTADASHSNKYMAGDSDSWANTSGYDVDVVLYDVGLDFKASIPSNIVFVGKTPKCDFTEVQDALESITDDSENNPYTIVVLEGTYVPFTMAYRDNTRATRRLNPRWISLIGVDATKCVFFDNKGNYKESPCEIWTNGTIKSLSFVDKTDAEHHTQEVGRTFAYAVHSDWGTCKTRFENCNFYSNAGPAIGIGLFANELLEFYGCRFECDCDGTFGATGQGAFFCHTATTTSPTLNQRLIMHDCVSIANSQTHGGKLTIVSTDYQGTYSFELQNVGFFGSGGPDVSIVDNPTDSFLSRFNFNNVPSTLNKV